MVWLFARLAPTITRHRLTTSHTRLQLRRSSALHASDRPNIATLLATAAGNEGHATTATGAVRTIRNQKHRSFLELGDGSTARSLQVVLDPSQTEGLGTGTAVSITGTWESAPPGKEQEWELKAKEVRIVGTADAQKYPIQKKYHSPEYLRTLPHLRLRTPFNALLARMRSECDFYLAQYFRDRHFIRVQPPIITSSDCEGAGEVFTVSSNSSPTSVNGPEKGQQSGSGAFFRNLRFLTVSSQLHLEAFVHEHQKVWTLSPTFRAEKSDTPRHLSEFWMLEVEVQTEDLGELMDTVEDTIRALTVDLQRSNFCNEILYANRGERSGGAGSENYPDPVHKRWAGLLQPSWPRMTYSDVIQWLQEAVTSKHADFQHEPSWAGGLQLEHEKFIVSNIGRGSPVFVTNYPQEIKPFYMLPSALRTSSDSTMHETVACFDLLLPEICEVVGGSLREHRLHDLERAMLDRSLRAGATSKSTSPTHMLEDSVKEQKDNLEWYVDLRRYGSVPHGGFGLGIDRLLGYLAGISNIKDAVPWPRYHGRCDC